MTSFSPRSCAMLLAVVAAVCVELYQAQHNLGRCSCPTTKKFLKGNMSDFQVLEQRPGCDKTELIVTVSRSENATEKVCLHTDGKLAKAFLRCWTTRINKNETRKMECLDRKRKSEEKTSED